MRSRVRFILGLGFVLVLAACSSNGTGGKTSTTTTATLSAAQLQPKLLTLADVGSAWKAGEAINTEDLSSVAQSLPCGDSALEPTVAKRLTAVTGVQFEPADRSYKHLIELVITGRPEQLHGDLQALFATMEMCPTTASSPSASTPTVTKLTIPALGDQRAAYVLIGAESAGSPTTWYVRDAAVRVGSVAITFGLTEILSSPQDKPQISDATFVQLLQTAVGKVSG